jgi:predicted porin
MKLKQLLLACGLMYTLFPAYAQEIPPVSENQTVAATEKQDSGTEEPDAESGAQTDEEDGSARQDEAALNEDPEAQRRSAMQEQPGLEEQWPKIDFYGSVRLHGINYFNEEGEYTELSLGDGASRIGIRGEWEFKKDWWLFGRAEMGFDVLDTFTEKGTNESDDHKLDSRLLYGGINSDRLSLIWGKNWSSYYQIAGMTDRFSIFGGEAAGVYNAGTDGGATGTGRADDVLQIKLYTSSLKALRIKPFNLNLQYQQGQPIPHVEGKKYGKAWGASAWLESQNDFGVGIAWNQAIIDDLEDPVIRGAGISGDARALAVSFRFFGDRWYSALVVSRLENIETTNALKYIDGYGAELYTQWEFKDRWWMVAGANWLKPDSDDEDAGLYEVAFGVLGLRYTFDSFKRMLYAEYRLDYGTLVDGVPRGNEITIGVRWDFGY